MRKTGCQLAVRPWLAVGVLRKRQIVSRPALLCRSGWSLTRAGRSQQQEACTGHLCPSGPPRPHGLMLVNLGFLIPSRLLPWSWSQDLPGSEDQIWAYKCQLPTQGRPPRDCLEEEARGMVSLDCASPQETRTRLLARAPPWGRREGLSPEK